MIVVSSSCIIALAVFSSIFLNSRSKLVRSVAGRWFLPPFFFAFEALALGASGIGGAMYSGASGLRILSSAGVGSWDVDWEMLVSSDWLLCGGFGDVLVGGNGHWDDVGLDVWLSVPEGEPRLRLGECAG